MKTFLRTMLPWLALLVLVVRLFGGWRAGELSALSFWILGVTLVVEMLIVAFLLRGFALFEREQHADLVRRLNEEPRRKKFG